MGVVYYGVMAQPTIILVSKHRGFITWIIYLRVAVSKGARCQFSYSLNGHSFIAAGAPFQAEVGRWIGSKVGLFCTRETTTNDSGWAEFDWFRVEANGQ